MTHRRAATLAVAVLLLAACGSSNGADSSATTSPPTDPATSTTAAAQLYPDVIEVEATEAAGTWRFNVTVSSPYDSRQRYADAWRVAGADGTVYGVRELTHDHAAEQPFTRSLDGVTIPDGVAVVVVEARDLINGYGGATVEVRLPGR
jgi:hypothetical protein